MVDIEAVGSVSDRPSSCDTCASTVIASPVLMPSTMTFSVATTELLYRRMGLIGLQMMLPYVLHSRSCGLIPMLDTSAFTPASTSDTVVTTIWND